MSITDNEQRAEYLVQLATGKVLNMKKEHKDFETSKSYPYSSYHEDIQICKVVTMRIFVYIIAIADLCFMIAQVV